jgi:hypothetical protein
MNLASDRLKEGGYIVSVEQDVKARFARVFAESDWRLFKRMAEFYLGRAAHLRVADMKRMAKRWRRLARNSEKRLFIGIGTELLLKALYLKHGFAINKPRQRRPPPLRFPFRLAEVDRASLQPDATYMLNDLIQSLSKVPAIGQLGGAERGLLIAKVFRNKEGHGVFPRHKFDAQDYRDVETALVDLYARAFGQTLQVRFSMQPGEKGVWSVRWRSGRTRQTGALPQSREE